jgi:hypothetical protein
MRGYLVLKRTPDGTATDGRVARVAAARRVGIQWYMVSEETWFYFRVGMT